MIEDNPLDTNAPADPSTGQRTDGIVIKEKHKRPGGRVELQTQNDLEARLNHLRAEAKQVCESYLANLDTDVATLADFLSGSSEVPEPDGGKAKVTKAWSKTLDRLTLKPSKGRKKDLRRIDDAVRSMMRSAFD